jgi:hypothetical protein
MKSYRNLLISRPADLVAVDCSVELKRHWHWIGDPHLPRDFVAIDSAVENFGRISVGHLTALECRALSLQLEGTVTLAHWRSHYEVPVSVCSHSTILQIHANV